MCLIVISFCVVVWGNGCSQPHSLLCMKNAGENLFLRCLTDRGKKSPLKPANQRNWKTEREENEDEWTKKLCQSELFPAAKEEDLLRPSSSFSFFYFGLRVFFWIVSPLKRLLSAHSTARTHIRGCAFVCNLKLCNFLSRCVTCESGNMKNWTKARPVAGRSRWMRNDLANGFDGMRGKMKVRKEVKIYWREISWSNCGFEIDARYRWNTKLELDLLNIAFCIFLTSSYNLKS